MARHNPTGCESPISCRQAQCVFAGVRRCHGGPRPAVLRIVQPFECGVSDLPPIAGEPLELIITGTVTREEQVSLAFILWRCARSYPDYGSGWPMKIWKHGDSKSRK
jgi:hypothetical protein